MCLFFQFFCGVDDDFPLYVIYMPQDVHLQCVCSGSDRRMVLRSFLIPVIRIMYRIYVNYTKSDKENTLML